AEAMAREVACAVDDEHGGDLVGDAGALAGMPEPVRTTVVRVAKRFLVFLHRDGDGIGRAGARGDRVGARLVAEALRDERVATRGQREGERYRDGARAVGASGIARCAVERLDA